VRTPNQDELGVVDIEQANVLARKAAIAKLFLQFVRYWAFSVSGRPTPAGLDAAGFLIESAKLASGAMLKAFCTSPVFSGSCSA